MPQHPNLRRNAMSIGVSLALSGAPAAVLAQENTLEEVVVTATKRERSVQDIPLSVTAVSGDSLVELNIQNGIDLPKAVPGLKLIYAGNSPQLILRGAGVAGLNDLAVPYYVDGLYRPRSAQALASWLDIDRVEVLRGPQGTLFGRNTLGGLVNIISNKPDTQAFDFGVAATGGDFDYQKFEGFVNVPLGDTMAFRVTASDTQRDPLVKNTYNSDAGLKDEDNTYARAQFRWEPTDGFDITLTATYWEDTANGNANFAYKPIGVSINPATGFTNGWSGNIQPRKGTWNGGDPSFNGGRAQAGDWPSNPTANTTPDDPHEIRSDFDNYRDLEETSWSALMNWDIGFATLRANVGYFEYESVNVFDVDLSPNPTEFLVQNGLGDDTAPCWYASRADMCGWVDGNQVNSEAIQADINLNSNGTGPLNLSLIHI